MGERRSLGQHLRVGASTTPGEVLVPRAAAGFSARCADVELDVRIADTEEIVAALKDREVEVAVVGREVDDPRLSAKVLEQDELVLVAAATSELAGSEVDPRDLADVPFVVRERGSATRRAAEEAFAGVGVAPKVAMELGSNAAVVAAVAEGAGLGVVPARQLGDDRHVGRVHVRGLSFRRPFVMLTEDGRPLSEEAEVFVEVLTEAAGA